MGTQAREVGRVHGAPSRVETEYRQDTKGTKYSQYTKGTKYSQDTKGTKFD